MKEAGDMDEALRLRFDIMLSDVDERANFTRKFHRDLVSQGTVAPELAAQVVVDSMVDEGVFENKTFLLGKNTIGATDVDSGEESGASDKETDVDALLSTLSLSSERSVKAIGIDELDNGYSVPDDSPRRPHRVTLEPVWTAHRSFIDV